MTRSRPGLRDASASGSAGPPGRRTTGPAVFRIAADYDCSTASPTHTDEQCRASPNARSDG
ncbi:MAG: hypothetical protein D6725_02120, partial [Planctomycetota bacterium]